MRTEKKIDHLTEDDPIPGQMWVCLSFLSPEGIRNCNVRGLKIRGVYATKEDADKRAKELQMVDPDFHVFVGEVGKWLPWDPNPDDVQDQVWKEAELQKIMEGYKDNLAKAKTMHKQREEDAIKGAAADEKNRARDTKQRLREKLEARKKKEQVDALTQKMNDPKTVAKYREEKHKEETEDLDDEVLEDPKKEFSQKETEIKKKEGLAKQERERLEANQEKVVKQKEKVENIDAKLAKIEELYKKLNQNKGENI